jgi:hypothetical protein
MRNDVPWLRLPNFRPKGVQKTVDRYKAELSKALLVGLLVRIGKTFCLRNSYQTCLLHDLFSVLLS